MNTLNYSIFINADKEKVWNTMLEDATYRQWTKAFNETSYYDGDWSEGSEIHFLGTDENGENLGGMMSEIAKNNQYEYISIKHLGVIENGVEKPYGEDGVAFENYSFTEKDGGTQLDVELTNLPVEYQDMMNEMCPKALNLLKEISEK